MMNDGGSVMDAEIKAEWLKRLRSGEIPQAATVLQDEEGGRCCLGVLCDIAVERGITDHSADGNTHFYGRPGGEWTDALPPEHVAAWAGFPTTDANIWGDADITQVRDPRVPVPSGSGWDTDGNGSSPLASLNDAGVTFLEIADLIEKHL